MPTPTPATGTRLRDNRTLQLIAKGAAVIIPAVASYFTATYDTQSTVESKTAVATEKASAGYEVMVDAVKRLEKGNTDQTAAMVEMAKQLAVVQGRLQTMEAIYIRRPPGADAAPGSARTSRRPRPVSPPPGVPAPKMEPAQLVQQLQKQQQVQQKEKQEQPLPTNLDSAYEQKTAAK